MTPKPIVWRLAEVVKLCRLIEPEVIKVGFHVALGGGVLYRGYSHKDCDLFFYPHCRDEEVETPWEELRDTLELLGFKFVRECDHSQYGDAKIVKETLYDGKRIDIFFVE